MSQQLSCGVRKMWPDWIVEKQHMILWKVILQYM